MCVRSTHLVSSGNLTILAARRVPITVQRLGFGHGRNENIGCTAETEPKASDVAGICLSQGWRRVGEEMETIGLVWPRPDFALAGRN